MAASNIRDLKTLYNKLLDGESTLVEEYQGKQQKFPYKSIENIRSSKKLGAKLNEFNDLLKDFEEVHYELSVHIIRETHDKYTRRYNMIATAHISLIQNLYLNKINFRKNYLDNKNSLWVAIWFAIISFILSLVSIGITFFNINIHSFEKSDKSENIQIEKKKDNFNIENLDTSKIN